VAQPGGLPACRANLNSCGANLAACNQELATCQHLPATGQTSCWDSSGAPIPCAGTGQDGDIQAGAALAYVDNGDGTVTDKNTGLMWEKKSDDTTIHDKDTPFTWADAFATFIATLNTSPCFAGHCDWRLPNVKELESIVHFENGRPAVSAAFANNCVSGCTVLTCSCTSVFNYWSSTTFANSPSTAWFVSFNDGVVSTGGKFFPFFVRAVRGGL